MRGEPFPEAVKDIGEIGENRAEDEQYMKIDACGKPCPQPVVLALKALQEIQGKEALEILVDNEAAVENLKRMAAQQGCSAQVFAEGAVSRLLLRRESSEFENMEKREQSADGEMQRRKEQTEANAVPGQRNTVVAIGAETMGQGDPKLGAILMKGYLFALSQSEQLPQTILFFNGGARLTTERAESLSDLRVLTERGVEILTCGTCLDYYGLKEKLSVGGVTNMYTISEKMLAATQLIRL